MFLFSCGKIMMLFDSDRNQDLHSSSIPRRKCLFTEPAVPNLGQDWDQEEAGVCAGFKVRGGFMLFSLSFTPPPPSSLASNHSTWFSSTHTHHNFECESWRMWHLLASKQRSLSDVLQLTSKPVSIRNPSLSSNRCTVTALTFEWKWRHLRR